MLPRSVAASSFVRRAVVCGSLFVSLVVLVGCGDSSENSVVTGKVTYKGQNVTGEVVFVSGKQRAASPITDAGTYTIRSPLKGDVEVLVNGPPEATAPAAKNTKKAEKGPVVEAPEPTGIAPPPKYAKAGNGLKLKVNGGEQVFDIDLK